jgi:shikimate kinase
MFSIRRASISNRRLIHKRNASNRPVVDLQVDREGVAVLTMQRAPVNSFNVELMTAIADTLEHVEKEKFKGLILTSVSISTLYITL